MKLSFKLIARYLMNESKPDEAQQVTTHLQANQALKRDVEKFQHLLSMKAKKQKITDVNTKWNELRAAIEQANQQEKQNSLPAFGMQHRRTSRSSVIIRFAAATMLLITFGILMQKWSVRFPWTNPESKYKVVKVGYQERYKLSLSDGTMITLDAGSDLAYPTEFRETRDVHLRGEAFFEVAHDRQKPFQVHVGDALIRVLGTKFNIRNWGDEYDVVVTVNEGKVLLQPEKTENAKRIVLTNGQQSTIGHNGLATDPISVDPDKYLGWMHNRIHFKNAKVREVLNQLERWYGFTFELSDPAVLDQSLTIHIQRTTLSDAIQLIGIITDMDVMRNEKNIKFIKKQ